MSEPDQAPADESAAQKPPLANIAYKSGDNLSEYETERCKLDLYLPPGGKNFATLVWFHGGALKAGYMAPSPQRQAEVIATANQLGMAMIFTGTRHFRH